MMIVMNTEAATTMLSQSTSFNCTIIKIPTITNAAAVTEEVNNAKTVEEYNKAYETILEDNKLKEILREFGLENDEAVNDFLNNEYTNEELKYLKTIIQC